MIKRIYLAAFLIFAIMLGVDAILCGAAVADTVPVSIKPPGAAILAEGQKTEIPVRFEIAPGYHIYAPEDKSPGVKLSFAISRDYCETFEVMLPRPVSRNYPAAGGNLVLFEGDFIATLSVVLGQRASVEDKIPVAVEYQACTDKTCTEPVSETLEIKLLKTASVVSSLVPQAAEQPSKSRNVFGRFYEQGFLFALLIAFFWGVVSSLTPCVYPMIPITVAFFAGQNEGTSRARTFSLALVFVFGIAISFAALGMAVTLIGVDMGSVMANPWIVATVCFLLIFFAGAMFELYDIKAPDRLMAKAGQSEAGFAGAFFMGLTMGLVAAPCVGPFAGSLLVFAATVKSIPIGFMMLFSYGMGLGMLFLAVAVGANFLPRSGMWMVRLKNFFGLMLLWITIYFWQFVMPGAYLLLTAGFYGAITASVLGVFSKVDDASTLGAHIAKALGGVALALACAFTINAFVKMGFIDFSSGGKNPAAMESENSTVMRAADKTSWLTDYEAGMKKATAEGRPVIIDFYADWCLPCKEMETAVFKNDEFIKATEDFVKIKLDCTKSTNPGAVIKMEKYKSPFMPYIVFYDKKGNIAREIEGYTGLKEMLDIVKKLK